MSRSPNPFPVDPDRPFPVGPYTPEDFPEVDVAAAQEVVAELAALKTATYTGYDRNHLVAAVVTGDGVVVRVSFARTAPTHPIETLERAIVAAVAEAHTRMHAAWLAVAARELPELANPPEGPGPRGGIEMAYDPQEADRHG